MANRVDVIIGSNHGWMKPDVLDRVKKALVYPTEFVIMKDPPLVPSKADPKKLVPTWNGMFPPNTWPLTDMLWRAKGIKPARIALLGFSASCTPVREILGSRDGGNVQCAIAIDGIHAGLDVWTRFARFAAWGVPAEYVNLMPGQRRCIITHSQVKPTYMSTTESAEKIWQDATGSPPTATPDTPSALAYDPHVPPVEFGCTYHPNRYKYEVPPFWYHRSVGGLDILGYRDLDPTGCTDHIYQAQVVLPQVVLSMLVPMWNAEPPSTGACMIGEA